MLNVKMAKNGSRTLIAIDGADKDRDELVFRIITAYTSGDEYVRKELDRLPDPDSSAIGQIESLTPPPIQDIPPAEADLAGMTEYSELRKHTAIVISSGEYQGMAPDAVLYKHGMKGLVVLFNMAIKMANCEEKRAICSACKKYMANIDHYVANMTRKQKETFIKCSVALYPDPKKLSSVLGTYRNSDEFAAHATETEFNHAVEIFVSCLKERGNK